MSDYQFRAWTGEYMVYQGEPDLETLQSFMHHYGGDKLMLRSPWKDSGGRYIFDGDILEHNDREWVVCLCEDDGWVCKSFGRGFFPLSTEFTSDSNVLGNIHEGKVNQIRHELIEEVKELADRYWGMNLTGGKFEDHLSEILDNYTIKRKP
jgi:hypothetical protein